MADSFSDPAMQAQLKELMAALRGQIGETQAMLTRAEATFSRAAPEAAPGAGRARPAVPGETVTFEEATARRAAQAQTEETAATRRLAESRVMAQAAGSKLSKAEQQLIADARGQAGSAELRAAAEAKWGATMQQSILRSAQMDDSLTRHGALTTEFIDAAARGEVTLREFGTQMGQTIGKFAGWTIAAGAVYGVVGAVSELARGAIDAQSAVQGLERFIPHLNRQQAGAQIGSIAQDLNVPIKDVGEASGAFARIFKNQTDVMTASRVAITATKLDNIQLADSYRYLTSLTQEYGLSASQLPGLFDQIEAAQAKGGARVSELLPALARSAAAVKYAGGDLNALLALEATAIVRTGQTGNVVGTAFARGSANFWRSQSSQQTLQRYGIGAGPELGFTKALENAIRQVSEGQFTGSQSLDISKAFFGPLRGGLLAGLFRSQGSLENFQKVTTPGNAAGQAQRELNALLDQADQKLEALKNNAQALGAALASSGLLTPLGAFVDTLNLGLRTTTELLHAWGQLPDVIKTAAGAALGLFGTRAITQRIGLTGVPFFGRSQSQVARAQVTRGLADESTFYEDQYRTAGRRAALANLTTGQALIARNEAMAGGSLEDQARKQRIYMAALERSDALELERASLETAANEIKTRNNVILADINRGMGAETALANSGVAWRLNTLTRGSAVPNPVVGVRGGMVQRESGLVVPASAVESEERALAQRTSLTVAASATAARGMAAARKTVVGLGSALGTLAGSIDPLLIAIIGLPLALEWLSAQQKSIDETVAYVRAHLALAPETQHAAVPAHGGQDKALKDFFAAQQHAFKEDLKVWDTTTFGRSQLRNAAIEMKAKAAQVLAGSGLDARLIDGAYKGFSDSLDRIRAAYEQQHAPAAAQALLSQAQQSFAASSEAYGSALPSHSGLGALGKGIDTLQGVLMAPLGYSTAAQGYSDSLKTLGKNQQVLAQVMIRDSAELTEALPVLMKSKEGRRKIAQLTSAQREGFAEAAQASGASPKDVAKYIENFNTWQQQVYEAFFAQAFPKLKGNNLFNAFMGMAPADAQAQLQAWDDQQKIFGASQGTMEKILTGYSALSLRASRSPNDPKLLAAVASMQSNYASGVSKSVQDALRQASAATTYGGESGALQSELSNIKALEAPLKKLMERFKNQPKVLAALQILMGSLQDGASQVLSQLTQAMQTRNALVVSQVQGSSPEADLQRAQDALSGPGGLVAQLKAARGAGADYGVIAGLQAKINDATNNISNLQSQNAKAIIDANDQVAKARISGTSPAADLARAQADVKLAQDDLRFDTAHHAGRAKIAQDYAALLNAQNGIQDLVRQQAQQADQDAAALIAARAGYAEAQTLDPVKKAQIALQADIKTLSTIKPADYKTYSEYQAAVLQQRTKVLGDRHAVTDQIVSGKEEDIQFYLDMGKISSQTAIDQYQALLRMHNLTKQTRQQIMEKIHALQTAGNSDFGALNLGTIKLPTPYEIRRAVMAAQQNVAVTQHYSTTIQVTDERSANAVGVQMDRYHSGTAKAMQRATGVR